MKWQVFERLEPSNQGSNRIFLSFPPAGNRVADTASYRGAWNSGVTGRGEKVAESLSSLSGILGNQFSRLANYSPRRWAGIIKLLRFDSLIVAINISCRHGAAARSLVEGQSSRCGNTHIMFSCQSDDMASRGSPHHHRIFPSDENLGFQLRRK